MVGSKVVEGPLSGPEDQISVYDSDLIDIEVEKVLNGNEENDVVKWSAKIINKKLFLH
ncbi:MAG: hypothetical protein U9O20_02260 [Patescibacteria group bacterium]|nr:hypothetical protein [Patescibacteria group bacterium]